MIQLCLYVCWAKKIHEQSKRIGSFVEVNCGGLSEDLLDAELFGHGKGAFTGASSENKGKLFLANNGTLFLDEIGSMSESMQKKLLKAIEEKSFYAVNSDKIVHSDFRVICATLDNLEDKILKGQFRFDLFQRLCGLSINLVPLRERKDDIIDLIKKELEQNEENSRKLILSKEAKEIIINYTWPGNIRELKRFCNLIKVIPKGMIGKEDVFKILKNNEISNQNEKFLTSKQLEHARKFGLNSLVEEIEKEVVQSVLRENKLGIRKTMSELKINQAKVYKYHNDGERYLL